jgi:hypothetical protein
MSVVKRIDVSFPFFTNMCICVCILYTHECLHLKTSSVTKLPYQDCKQKKKTSPPVCLMGTTNEAEGKREDPARRPGWLAGGK